MEGEDFLGTLGEYACVGREGNGRLVFVAGEFGIGKRALIDEFQRETDGVRGRATVYSPPGR